MQIQYLINGKLDGQLTPLDRGYAYGDGVFRTLPVRQGLVQDWQDHYRKLHDDCAALGIACPSATQLLADIAALCSNEVAVVVKIVITRGDSVRGYAVIPGAQPNRALLKSPYPEYPEQHYSQGVRLHLCALRLSWQPRLAGIKHLNRLENVLARMEWQDAQFADGLLLDGVGNVIECTMSNLFMRCGNTLVTPELTQCGVAGVTRQRILALAPRLGYAKEVRSFGLPELLQADEVIICNSVFGAWQVRALGEATWAHGVLASRLRASLSGHET
jgi:4-amino-4-deoxychorismate lyase